MASLDTHISWTDTTWNPTTGCTPASDGCKFCYARSMTNRLFGGNFEQVRLHPNRLHQVKAFGPIRENGHPRPRMVFVNSMSDLMHPDIPDAFRDQVFDRIEATPGTVYQVLTKRGMTLRRYVADRYTGGSVPPNLWLGVSVEDDRVRGRIDMLRRLKDDVGEFCAFLSIEPLIGEPTRHDYTGIDWVLIGGESGPGARDCLPHWVRLALEFAALAGAARWFKQWGQWRNNPLYWRPGGAVLTGARHIDRVRSAIEAGECMASIERVPNGTEKVRGEKGGATIDGQTFRERPPHYARLSAPILERLT